MTLFIGVGYQKRNGKGEFSHALAAALRKCAYEVEVRAYADPLKDFVKATFGATDDQLRGVHREQAVPVWVLARTKADTWRGVLQNVGTDLRNLYEGIWIRTAMRLPDSAYLQPEVVIMEDMRYVDEATAIMLAGGETVKILRPSVVSADSHSSESGLNGYYFDKTVVNDGTLEELQAKAEEYAKYLIDTHLEPNGTPQ